MSETPSPQLVRAQLERLLASQALNGSDQLKRLLRLVVERSLDGQASLLKEYNLGLEVFQRPPDYDPKVDPIVRVQARRLRAKLDEYYAGEGAMDTLLIQIPKGAYTPSFGERSSAAAVVDAPTQPAAASQGALPNRRSAAWLALPIAAIVILAAVLVWNRSPLGADPGRSVAVLPLKLFAKGNSGAHISDQATEVLTTELARNQSLRVLSRTTASRYAETTQPLPEIARALGVRWVVEGGIGFEGTRAYVKLRAVDALSDRKVWAEVYDFQPHDLIPTNSRIAGELAKAIEAQMRAAAPIPVAPR